MPERTQNLMTLRKMAKRDFTDDEGVAQNLFCKKQFDKCFVARPQMIDPYRCVDQNHFCVRLRRGIVRLGALPPSIANRRAASRSTSAFSASRTRADFSLRPVYAWAWVTSSSSSAKVVRICNPSS